MEKTKLMSRRNFIKSSIALGGLLVAGGIWRAIETGVFRGGEGPAYLAWGKQYSGLEELVNSAILAANAHNTQPWKFRLNQKSIDLFVDLTRNIGTADPFYRELYISLGCAIENLMLAAGVRGYSPTLSYFPNPFNQSHIVSIDLTKKTNPVSSELYQAIPKRRMNRAPYDKNRQVSKEILQSLMDLNKEKSDIKLFLFDSPKDKQTIGNAMIGATEAFITDKDQVRDDAKWMRQSMDAIEKQKDGITLDAQGLPTWKLAAAKMLPPMTPDQNNKFWLDTVKNQQIPTAAAFGFIAVGDLNNVQQMVKAGQLWQTIQLWGTTKGLGMQIMNQLSERRDREISLGIKPYFGDKLFEILGDPKWNSIIQFRLGYPTKEPLHSPRRPVSEVIFSTL